MSARHETHPVAVNDAGLPPPLRERRDILRVTIWLLWLAAIVLLAALLIFVPQRSVMLALPVLLMATGAVAAYFQWRDRLRLVSWIVAGGIWCFVVASVISLDGMHGPSAVAYPAIVVTIGWLFGVRAALGAAGLAVAVALVMDLSAPLGAPLDTLRGHPIDDGIAQFVALSLSAALVAYFAQLYQDRLAALHQAGRELDGRAQALRASEADLDRAQAVARVGSWVGDPASGGIQLSVEACRIFGWPADRHPDSRDVMARVHPEDAARVGAAWQAALNGAAFDLENRIVVDGIVRWVRQKAEVEVAADGSPRRVLGIIQDITERKHAEAELEKYQHRLELLVAERTAALSVAKEAAESASRAKSVFLGNMSHELRTPMNAIMGMTMIALRKSDDPALRDPLLKIDEASKHLLALINDILDISKIESDRLTLDSAYFTLAALRDNVLELLAPQAAEKGLALGFELTPELAARTLVGDTLRLGQIVLNLAGNAIKFTETGAVDIRVGVAEEQASAVVLRWEVEDSGIGIAAVDQKRIFSAFEQADGSLTRRFGGTGLGLAISSRLARMMGGDMGVDSEPGRGSTFWFTVRLGKARDATS
ncbi:MAG: ATP-binding protein [Sulfuritalea sp.]|nr:ATP-binding protein [Sulfuritalea sp.]